MMTPLLTCGLFDVSGCANDAVNNTATGIGQFAGTVIANALTWWVQTPSTNPDTDAVRQVQGYEYPVIAIILMASVLTQCIRIVVQRRMTPLLEAGVGVIRYVFVTTTGLLLVGAAVQAADALSQWIVQDAISKFTTRMQGFFTLAIFQGNASALIIMALIAAILGLIQWVLAWFRQAGILVLATLLPLAASGSLSQSGRQWLNKLIPMLISLIAYKPLAAMIYALGLTFISSGNDFGTVMTGLTIVVLASIAMPALLRFFSWAGVSIGGGGGGFGAAVSSFAGARLGRGGGGGGSPTGAAELDNTQSNANRMSSTGPGSDGGGDGNNPPTSQPPPGAAPHASAGGMGGGVGAPQVAGETAAGAGSAGAGAANPALAVGAAAVNTARGAADGAAGTMTGGSDDQQQ